MNRLLCIGDIHGCVNTLKSLIGKVNPNPEDTLIFLGDYIDRGASSFEVIEYLIELSTQHNCVFLMGNHEDMWLDYLKGELGIQNYQMYFRNGGKSTLQSYVDNLLDEEGNKRFMGDGMHWDYLPQSHRDFYNNLKVYHEVDNFVFVHAGLEPQVALEDQEPQTMMWTRNNFIRYRGTVLEGKVVVHGHTPMDRYEMIKYNSKHTDRLNVDSGCVFGYHLTCIDVRTRFKSQQKCIDVRTS